MPTFLGEMATGPIQDTTPESPLTLQRARGVLTSPQLLSLFSQNVPLFQDSPNILLVPRYLFIRKEAGIAYTLNGSATLRLNYGASSGSLSAMQITTAGMFDTAIETTGVWFGVSGGTFNVGLNGANSPYGLGLRWMLPTADFTVGTGSFFWSLYYYILPRV